jgi:hypothetical protein
MRSYLTAKSRSCSRSRNFFPAAYTAVLAVCLAALSGADGRMDRFFQDTINAGSDLFSIWAEPDLQEDLDSWLPGLWTTKERYLDWWGKHEWIRKCKL